MSTVIENLRTLLKAKIDALKTVMAVGYDPTFSYTYDRHQVSNLQLTAVSIDVLPSEEGQSVGALLPVSSNTYQIVATVRIHTAYANGPMLEVANTQLLDSVNNYLNEHRNLGSNYRTIRSYGMNPRAEFFDSATKGGELNLSIKIPMEREQL